MGERDIEFLGLDLPCRLLFLIIMGAAKPQVWVAPQPVDEIMLLFLWDGPRLLGNISLRVLGLTVGLTFGLAFAPLVLPRHGFLLLIFTLEWP